jgi:hypothetical protein
VVTEARPASFEVRSKREIERGALQDMRRLHEPLPPTLSEALDPKLTAAHAKLVARAEKAAAATVEAAAAVEAADVRDRQAAVDAAKTGKPTPAPTRPTAEQAPAEAEATRSAHETAVVQSADALLAEALPLIAETTAKVDERIATGQQRQRELLEAALTAGQVVAELQAERGWLTATVGRRVRPFQRGAARLSRTDQQIRMALDVDAHYAEEQARRREQAERAERAAEEHDARRRELAEQGRLPGSPARVRTTTIPGVGVKVERVEPDQSSLG